MFRNSPVAQPLLKSSIEVHLTETVLEAMIGKTVPHGHATNWGATLNKVTMAEPNFLTDDHTLLGLQVFHVMALVRVYEDWQSEIDHLHLEIIRQADILQQQIAEHFAFEEMTAFPHLEERYPDFGARLDSILTQHDAVLDAFDKLHSVLHEDSTRWSVAAMLAKGIIFEKNFEHHVASETRLLNLIKSRIPAKG